MCGSDKQDGPADLPPAKFDRLRSALGLRRRSSPTPAEGASRAWIFWPLVSAVALMAAFVTFPAAPPDNDTDSSLSAVLSYAHQHRIQFGPDLVFTYGPLGFLIFFYFAPHAAVLRMAVDVALCLGVAIGLCLVAWRLRPPWRWLLLALFLWIAPNVPTRADLVVDVGLGCWGLLCFVESGKRLGLCAAALTTLAVFCALAKISFLFVATASVLLVGGDLLVRGHRRLACGMVGGFGFGFVLGWLGSGQHLLNLGSFFSHGMAVVVAYNDALGLEGPAWVREVGFAFVPVVLILIGLRTLTAFAIEARPHPAGATWLRRGLLWVWVSLLTFTVWKYAFVRAGREVFFFGFVSVLALVLGLLAGHRAAARRLALALGLGACLVSLIVMQMFFFVGWPDSLTQPFRAFARNLACLVNPAEYRRQMGEAIAANRRDAQLPRCRQIIGRASVDVFGQCQAYALGNDLNYHPRPVFQSYVACSRRLMELNERFYLSSAAPEYVLFRLNALDRKFPPLEDGPALRALLTNYKPLLAEGPFVLLQANTAGRPVTSLVLEGTVRPGQPIDLRPFGAADLWLEVSLEPTLPGRLRRMLYRPPTVRLALWREPGGQLLVRNRAPASMLAAGFLASPLLLRNEDVVQLYTSGPVTRPGACSVELLPGEEYLWKESVRFRIYKIESRLGRCVPPELAARFKHPEPQPQPAGPSAVAEGEGVARDVNGAARPFKLIPAFRWRPTAPPLGGLQENLAFALFLLLPVVCGGLLWLFARRVRQSRIPAGWGRLLAGNVLALACLVSPALLAGEIYYRFFYDTTDSLAYTKTSERWVQRHWHVNAAGCRDDVEYAATIAPGRRRLTFVGDSFTAGHGIKDVENRFPNRLRRVHPDWGVQVLAAVGLDTGGELALMKKAFARGYQVDQVVLVYCLNDLGDLLPAEADATARVLADLDNSGWLVHSSYLINLWYHHYEASRIPYLKDYCSFVREAYRRPVWAQQMERLKAFRDLVQSHGGRLSVVTFPLLQALGPGYPYQSIHDELDRFWRELGVPHLDLLSVYGSLPSSRLTVNAYDAHPNEYANQLAATAMDKWLLQARPGGSNGLSQ